MVELEHISCVTRHCPKPRCTGKYFCKPRHEGVVSCRPVSPSLRRFPPLAEHARIDRRCTPTCSSFWYDQVVLNALRAKLHLNAAMLQIPIGLSKDHVGVVDLVRQQAAIIVKFNEQIFVSLRCATSGDQTGRELKLEEGGRHEATRISCGAIQGYRAHTYTPVCDCHASATSSRPHWLGSLF